MANLAGMSGGTPMPPAQECPRVVGQGSVVIEPVTESQVSNLQIIWEILEEGGPVLNS